jgi:hypothetical protein
VRFIFTRRPPFGSGATVALSTANWSEPISAGPTLNANSRVPRLHVWPPLRLSTSAVVRSWARLQRRSVSELPRTTWVGSMRA